MVDTGTWGTLTLGPPGTGDMEGRLGLGTCGATRDGTMWPLGVGTSGIGDSGDIWGHQRWSHRELGASGTTRDGRTGLPGLGTCGVGDSGDIGGHQKWDNGATRAEDTWGWGHWGHQDPAGDEATAGATTVASHPGHQRPSCHASCGRWQVGRHLAAIPSSHHGHSGLAAILSPQPWPVVDRV